MKIAFIGTFNPVTLGHLLMAQTTVNKVKNTGIIFIPVSDLYQKDELTTAAIHRKEMLTIATKDNPLFSVDGLEIEYATHMKYQPKTIETLYMLQHKNLEEVGLLIGTDNFLDLHTWYRAEEMVKNFKIIVYPRLGFKMNKEDQELFRKYPDQFIFVDTDLTTNISSTEIRKNFKSGKSNAYLIPHQVLNYINNHNYLFLNYYLDKEKEAI